MKRARYFWPILNELELIFYKRPWSQTSWKSIQWERHWYMRTDGRKEERDEAKRRIL